MNNIIFLILRRMRAPLIAVIVSFGIAVAGMTLMPGMEIDGKTSHLTLFEAFYIISYTATTIGFGEVPHPFSTQQRLWMTLSIYMTVIPWFYAIGKIISLFQDPGLRLAVTTSRFANEVERLHEPFYIVCGYGETGSLLVSALDRKNMRVVVIEILQDRVNELELEDYQSDIPVLCADAQLPDVLIKAGVRHPMCAGVAALTDDDHVNLAVAIAVKLIHPSLMVLGRAENAETAANMASFGTDHIINPYTLFGEHLAMEVHALGTYLLHEWLTGVPGQSLPSPACPPIGKWVVCGYGRFGKSVVENLQREHITMTIVEADPERTGCEDCIIGSGTEAKTLEEAGIRDALGIVAGTDNDINNLSIVMTAREMNPGLFVVIRKNRRYNEALFEHFNADITMQPSDIIAHECLAHMISPLLAQFLSLVRTQSNAWANQLISQLVEIVGENVPETWAITIDHHHAPAVNNLLSWGLHVSLDNLTRDPGNRKLKLDLVPLLLLRGNQTILQPEPSMLVMHGDQILLCGRPGAKEALPLTLSNHKVLNYIIDGQEIADGFIWRWLSLKLKKKVKRETV
ncbi:Voltage-gated potassium channel Kch [Methylophilaceae bacterium]|nr:Voltage-gated potassium channel Kch [Methylophilaceae bacterium]